ncbi:MAG: MliC family protein [Candidatus Pacebacteria bacterium]|nr:MliC family protein [Candidatus Paceibacterota bacterium]MDD4074345.1 MliC family protein [Candidatus Paceibacterota bacterium]
MKPTTIALLVFIYAFSFFTGFIIGKQYQAVFIDMIDGKESHNFSAIFYCEENKFIIADFFDRKVELSLSDGRFISIPQTISASGVRYANSDETFVFWNKGNTAFIDEKGETTFKNCVANESK